MGEGFVSDSYWYGESINLTGGETQNIGAISGDVGYYASNTSTGKTVWRISDSKVSGCYYPAPEDDNGIGDTHDGAIPLPQSAFTDGSD